MNSFFILIKSDYLQRTRSYAFLITLCISVAVGYTFVPEPNAKYITVQIANYIGYYNSAWFGYVTAIMASAFLSLIGYYLINDSITKDIKTKVGIIITTTKTSNFKYLLSKVFSNFLVLLTILLVLFSMSIVLFFLFNDGYPFEPLHFIKPYVLITIPALFIIAVLALVFEVFLGRYSVIQNIVFFCLFGFLINSAKNTNNNFSTDVIGSTIVLHQLEKEVMKKDPSIEKVSANIGFVFKNETLTTNKFEFNGIDFPTSFIISRIVMLLLGIAVIFVVSLFFHRFDVKEKTNQKMGAEKLVFKKITHVINITNLPKVNTNYGIFSLVKTEFLLLIRKGKKWLWIFNFIGMILLIFIPVDLAHLFVLPILWFLQVGRLSEITTKEISNQVHYFAFASYKPTTRLLTSQILASIGLTLFLAFPLLIRFLVLGNFTATLSIILGGIFIVLLASFLGIITQSKKLFEVLFFLITYANINKVPFLDYFGGLSHNTVYSLKLGMIITCLITCSFLMRKHQLKKL